MSMLQKCNKLFYSTRTNNSIYSYPYLDPQINPVSISVSENIKK